MSPFNSKLMKPLNKIFAPLVENDYAAFIFGGVEEGMALLNHPEVEKWFMTGKALAAKIQHTYIHPSMH